MFGQNDNRISLQNALSKKNYDRAYVKIKNNIKTFCTNIQELQDYSLKVGSKSDNKEKSEQM